MGHCLASVLLFQENFKVTVTALSCPANDMDSSQQIGFKDNRIMGSRSTVFIDTVEILSDKLWD